MGPLFIKTGMDLLGTKVLSTVEITRSKSKGFLLYMQHLKRLINYWKAFIVEIDDTLSTRSLASADITT